MSDQPNDESDRPQRDQDHPLRRVSLRSFESLIDQQMAEAERAGQFRNLPGAGKPLDLGDDDGVPDELRVAHRMLKNAGYAPPWIELQKSIRADQDQLDRWLAQANRRWPNLGEAERTQLRAEYEARLRALNKQRTTYNLTAPSAAGQLPLLQIERELRKLGGEG